MLEIPWRKHSSTTDTCKLKDYLFKRIKRGETYRYEVWAGTELLQNNLDYWGCLKYYENVKDGKFGYK